MPMLLFFEMCSRLFVGDEKWQCCRRQSLQVIGKHLFKYSVVRCVCVCVCVLVWGGVCMTTK